MNKISVSGNRTGDLEAVLDECLSQIDRGESIKACVAQYPMLEAQLEPLLRLALQVKDLRQEQRPSPAALQAGRQRLLHEAARLRSARIDKARTSQVPWWLNLQALMRRSMVAVILATLLLATALGAGTIAASAKSLPGDALYPVKRMTEGFQLLLTFDRQTKAQLVQTLDERRREEAKAIASSQRIAEMSFRGRVESTAGVHWTISGVPVHVSDETVIEEDVAVGTLVRVHVRSLSDGTLSAMRISVEPEGISAEPTVPPALPTPTTIFTATPTPTDVAPTLVPVQPAAPPSTPSPTVSATPSATPSATATMVPPTPTPPREVKVRFKGRIEALAADAWTIDGKVVRIDAGTRIDERESKAQVGAIARVVAVPRQDGTLLAIEITIERSEQAPEQPFEFQGLIESFGPTRWVVGGHALTIAEDTVIEGSPQPGLLAEVKALRQSDGSLRAVHIFVRLPTQEVQFEGLIESLGAGEWTVEGVTVRLDAETHVTGTPTVGLVAEVQGLLLPDGAVLARRITVQPPPTATLEPTIEPTRTATTAASAEQTPEAPGNSREPTSWRVRLPLPVTPVSPSE